jgi:hypothetical protein
MDTTLAQRGKWRKALFGSDWRGRFLLPPGTGADAYEGRLRWEGDAVAVFVKHPPRTGMYEHERCLQLIDRGWFRIHFVTAPRSLETAVAFTEDFLLHCRRGR